MSLLLDQAFDAETFRKQGLQLVNDLADYLSDVKNLDKTIPYQKPEESLTYWSTKKEPMPFNALMRTILNKSTKLHSPKYMGHQVVPPVPVAALAGFFTEFINNGMAVYEMGMAFNPIEKIVCDLLCEKSGYTNESSGLLTSGGTLGNLTALLTARAKIPQNEIWNKGLGQEKLAIMVSEEAHYCVDRAARIMGLGDSGIIKIPVNEDYTLNHELLESYLTKANQDGLTIFALIGSAASTSTGSHDDLIKLGEFAAKNNIWFHVDAAHGGGAIFSKKYKHLLKGLELADSIVIDLHKMLLTPALATAVLYKNGSDSYETFHQKAQYLWDNADQDWFNSGKRTFECTKFGIGIKFYAIWQEYGERIFEENIDHLYDLAKSFSSLIKESKLLELALEPSSNIVNFRPKNFSNEQVLKIREELINDGEFYLVSTVLRSETYLRTSLMNTSTTVDELKTLVLKIEKICITLFPELA